MEDNCDKYGLSRVIGPKLRELVQIQLANELNNLLGMSFKFDFDWSESCIEGHDGMFLDGQTGLGVLYLLFCWTLIPAFIALIDFIVFLSMNKESFDLKYNRVYFSHSIIHNYVPTFYQ